MADVDIPDDESSAYRLTSAIRAELTALAAGNLLPRVLIEEARDLNAEAMLRARAKIVTVEKRLAKVQTIAGEAAPLTYCRGGRWAGWRSMWPPPVSS